MVEWRIPVTYKIRFRGGPNHNKVIAYRDLLDIIVVPISPWKVFDGIARCDDLVTMRRGRYTRAIVPNKRGEYYYVWLGES
jgi:hypothetical protein